MFTKEELKTKTGWGHSSIDQAVDFTKMFNVRKTLICHHAPYRSDADIDELKSKLSSNRIEFGYESMSFSV
jgi:ribonuclease BN (tRNA processing enzyme)